MVNAVILAAGALIGGFLILLLVQRLKFRRLFGPGLSSDFTSRDFGTNTGIMAERVLRSREGGGYAISFNAQEKGALMRRRNAVKLMVRRFTAGSVIALVVYYIFFSRSPKSAAAIIGLLVVQEIVKRLTKPEEVREEGKQESAEHAEREAPSEEPVDVRVDDEQDQFEKAESTQEHEKEGDDLGSGWDTKL